MHCIFPDQHFEKPPGPQQNGSTYPHTFFNITHLLRLTGSVENTLRSTRDLPHKIHYTTWGTDCYNIGNHLLTKTTPSRSLQQQERTLPLAWAKNRKRKEQGMTCQYGDKLRNTATREGTRQGKITGTSVRPQPHSCLALLPSARVEMIKMLSGAQKCTSMPNIHLHYLHQYSGSRATPAPTDI